ncbi:MAG: ABC transporter ATP-binding protein [Desulfobulbaceae bacterium]|nr:ABC transporter ATP-binding protein [Desulfobulbaceae bacterium]
MGRLELRELTIRYGAKTVISELNLQLQDGEILSLLGPSGAGKSTVLKAVAGLLPPFSGSIAINGQPADHLPAERRDTVLIFQKPLLFPFLNVGQNIAFGLRMTGHRGAAARQRIERMIAITGLQGLELRRVHQLSGGQQQRVALARGLVLEPSILLLDEPFSSLDAELREQMRELIRTIQQQTKTTMLFVTHDQSEAFGVSDRVALLLDGRLRQTGPPEQVFYRPADVDVARFFGCNNVLPGSIRDGYFHGARVRVPTERADCNEAVAMIRPEDVRLYPAVPGSDRPTGRISGIRFEGAMSRLTVTTEDGPVSVLSIRPHWHLGELVGLEFPADRLHVFPAGQEK